MSKLTVINVNVDFETIRNLTGMTTDEIETNEGNIDSALFQAFQSEFSEAEDVRASCGYVSELTVEAYDDDNDPTTVDSNRVQSAIATALNSL